jgi:hypothetical protein
MLETTLWLQRNNPIVLNLGSKGTVPLLPCFRNVKGFIGG